MGDQRGMRLDRVLGPSLQKIGGGLLCLQNILRQRGDVIGERRALIGEFLLLFLNPRARKIDRPNEQQPADAQQGDLPAEAKAE